MVGRFPLSAAAPRPDPFSTSTRRRRITLMSPGCENSLGIAPRVMPRLQRERFSEDHHAQPRRAANHDRASPGKDDPPEERRHADLRDAENGVVTGNRCRKCETCRDDNAQSHRPGKSECYLTNAEG